MPVFAKPALLLPKGLAESFLAKLPRG
jgi:hypothetical protein